MLTIRMNPLRELAAMECSVDRIFGEVFGRPANGKANEPAFFRLPMNIELKDGKYLITAPLAGFKPEEVEVTLADGVLTISAKHRRRRRPSATGTCPRRSCPATSTGRSRSVRSTRTLLRPTSRTAS